MKLKELIEHVGFDNIQFQELHECCSGMATNKYGITTITFKTNAITAGEAALGKPKLRGVILWIPEDKIPL